MQLWAHRGANRKAPENTLAAFQLAVEAGVDGVEFDVQLSNDGHPVVIHDEKLDRTTDGTGWVAVYPLESLQELDCGDGQHIPTLDEVLELLAPTEVRLNVELKNSVVPYPGLEAKVVSALARHGLLTRAASVEPRVVLSSFDLESVRRLARMRLAAEVAALYEYPIFFPFRRTRNLGATAIHPHAVAVRSARYVERAHAAGLKVRVWTVDDPTRQAELAAWGVDGIFTNSVPSSSTKGRGSSPTMPEAFGRTKNV
ncbi:MAG: glycerophosphodiester phosphodiesterase [Propionibacteriaceae bacterium]|jgi:glycerophosphoryl diester phosphodiesterase|nr:glycerophosphodiester phosphodiesterase [Propionibacteriaceae bacterium]